jgi:hypothetical protein
MTTRIEGLKPFLDELRVAMRKPLSNLSRPWWYLICAAVFFFALALRIAHSRAGLPYIEDDTDVYANSIYMNRRQSLDPIRFDIPSLSYNFGYFVNLSVGSISRLVGRNTPPENLAWDLEGWGWTLSNPDFLLANRLVLSIVGSLTCLLAIAAGTAVVGRLAGLIGSLALAVSPFMIEIDSRFSPNGLNALFFFCCVYFALLFFRTPTLTIWVLSLVCGGLAAGSKYTGAMSLIAPALALMLSWREIRSRKRIAFLISAPISAGAAFLATTPYFLIRPKQVLDSVLGQREHYFLYGHYGADVAPGLTHAAALLRDFAANLSWLLLGLGLLGLVVVLLINFRSGLILLLPYGFFTVLFVTSSVNRHINHAVSYPVLTVGVGAGVSLFMGLWLVGRQRRWRGASLLAVPMVAAFVPVGLAMAGGFQQIATDWRYQDPRVKAIDALATGQYGSNIVMATELRVHPAERERLSGVATARVLPLEQIAQCDFSPDTTLVLPTSVTTWREAAARRIGEIKPANELNADLQRLISNVTPSAQFGTNETVLDYNFTDPQLVIVKAGDLTACA